MNSVYLASGQYVIRFREIQNGNTRLIREAELIGGLNADIPVAPLIGHGIAGVFEYQISGFVEGLSLFAAWPRLAPDDRLQVMGDICKAADLIHSSVFEDFGYICLNGRRFKNWRNFLISEFDASCRAIEVRNYDHQVIRWTHIRDHFTKRVDEFDWNTNPCLIHNDLTPSNLLVRAGRLVAILDWELAVRGPVDMDAFKIEYCSRHPEVQGFHGDYSGVWDTAKSLGCLGGPQVQKQRMKIYEILSMWKSLEIEGPDSDPVQLKKAIRCVDE